MLASLCILAYKRPERLKQCLDSIHETIDYPCEIIVNLDGGDDTNSENILQTQFLNERISKLILNCGKNRGVGRSFQNCLGVAEGEYIFKIDTDLTFKPQWLSSACSILKTNADIGAVSLFDYRHYDPNDSRFNVISEINDCFLVDDFVSSIYGFRKEDLAKIVPVEDDGNHSKLGTLAITKKDYVINSGFGVGKSVYVSGTMDHHYKTPTFNSPVIFKNG